MPDNPEIDSEMLVSAILTQAVLERATSLGIKADPSLSDPQWVNLCVEAMQLFNSWMAWDATKALPAYKAAFGGGSPTTPPATTTSPAPPPTGSPTTVPTVPAGPAVPPAKAVNPVASAMTALGL